MDYEFKDIDILDATPLHYLKKEVIIKKEELQLIDILTTLILKYLLVHHH